VHSPATVGFVHLLSQQFDVWLHTGEQFLFGDAADSLVILGEGRDSLPHTGTFPVICRFFLVCSVMLSVFSVILHFLRKDSLFSANSQEKG